MVHSGDDAQKRIVFIAEDVWQGGRAVAEARRCHAAIRSHMAEVEGEAWITHAVFGFGAKVPEYRKERAALLGAVLSAVLFQGSIDGGTLKHVLSWEFLPLPLAVPFIRLYPPTSLSPFK